MFSKRNKNGKLACTLGTPAFLLSQVAEYAAQHRYELIERPMLSPIINYILSPYRYIEAVILEKPVFGEPSVTRLTIFYVFEGEAIVICFVLSIIMSMFAIYFSYLGVQNYEFSIWYTNGFMLGFLVMISANMWVGLIAATIVMLFVNRIRRAK